MLYPLGNSVIINCESNNVLLGARYPCKVAGSFQTSTFQPVEYAGDPTSCPNTITCLSKSGGDDSRSQGNVVNLNINYRDEL
jgi:hypothetical protein